MGTKPTDGLLQVLERSLRRKSSDSSKEPRGARRTRSTIESSEPIIAKATLKPCPFDGGKAEIDQFKSRRFPYKVQCIRCFISTPGFVMPELAVDVWNRRVV